MDNQLSLGMRVYFINTVCDTGSTGRIVASQARKIIEDGGEIRIAYGRGECRSKDLDSIRITGEADRYCHALMTRLTDKHGLYSKKATKRLVEDIKKFNPDLIMLHNLHGYYINYEMLMEFLRGYGKAIRWTLHDCWTYTGHCAYYSYAHCEKWKTGCEKCSELKQYPACMTGGNVSDNYERKKKAFAGIPNMTLITPSEWLKNEVKKSFLNEYPVEVINNTVNTDVFKKTDSDLRERFGIKDKTLLLGVANIWDRRKGLEDFLRLKNRLDDKKFAMVLIGLNDKQIRDLPEDVIGIKHTESVEELAMWYSVADYFLNLTHEDNYPTTNLEAVACGTRVITYNVGGCIETIGDEDIAVDEGDIESIINIVRS